MKPWCRNLLWNKNWFGRLYRLLYVVPMNNVSLNDIKCLEDTIFSFFYFSTFLLVENLDFLSLYLFYRTQEKLPMPSGNCLWRRLRGIWRMLWPINRPFPSHDSAVVLDVLLRQRIGIQMDRDDGLSNQQSSFLTCSRMLRVMLRYVSYVCLRIVAVYIISVGL